ncbi:MAG: UDP-N-acetylmuramoyl-tripeptide--D-alanyl-D-alanine ligase [Cytophagaceae bacterium]|nr:UDP-N-acetylmuramoyl-tripeptide--D-alanyl-D-alanine ligase [Cytophagaceae bacterium]
MLISTEELYQRYRQCGSVSTDTRKIEPDALFFALKGPNFNANALAQPALDAGARYAVVDEAAYQTDERMLLVTDALTALQDLARFHRNTLHIPVLGLTGSNGKTTTKELLNAVLSQKYVTYATRGNFNNHIGVPLTVLGIGAETELAIIEMGANHTGEIRDLCAICRPTYGLITNIGKAHLEGFGGLEGVRRGKGELYDFLAQTSGVVFVNAHQTVLVDMATERTFREKINYLTDAITSPTLLEESPHVIFADTYGNRHETHLTGRYNFENMATALAVGSYFGVDETLARRAVRDYQPDNNRSQVIRQGSNTIWLDAYNANPSSMAAALHNFAALKADRKMVILGDMYELGEEAPAEHEALGKLISECDFGVVLLAGELMQNALAHLPKAYYFPDKFGLHIWLQDHPSQHTHVLVKGSRGMKLESVVPFL